MTTIIESAFRRSSGQVHLGNSGSYLYEQADPKKGLAKPDRVCINAMEAGGTYRPESMKLSAALERDRDLYSGDKDERPFKYAVESFIEVIGDKDVTAITRADVSEWLGAQKREGLAPATVKRRYGTIKALVARALLDLDSDKRNPFDGFKMTGATGGVTDRLPLNHAMLELIETYLTSGRVGFETRALIQIMRGTGTGPAEAGGLVVSDVHLTGNIPFVSIRPNALRNLKTSARDRQVPLGPRRPGGGHRGRQARQETGEGQEPGRYAFVRRFPP